VSIPTARWPSSGEVHRLDPRVIGTRLVTLSALRNQIGLLVSLLAVLGLRGGVRVAGLVAVLVAIGAVSAGRAGVEWMMFSYAVDRDRLVVRRGMFRRSLTVVPLDRIRGVDVHASPLQRLLGIAVVRVDAAATGGNRDEAVLDAVSRQEAQRLRRVLLREVAEGAATVAPASAAGVAAAAATAELGVVLARLRPGWLVYAPLVGSYLLAPVAAFIAAQQLLDELRIPLPAGITRLLDGRLAVQRPDPRLVAAAVAAAIAVCVAGAVAAAAVANWGFTLTRRGGALVSERGLLSRRQVSLEQARIRGYALAEPLPLRAVGAARLIALVTGLGGENSRRAQLLPLGPAGVAREVAAAAVLPFTTPLRRHPAAARRRRLARATLPWLLLTVPLALLHLWPAVAVAGGLAVLGLPLGIDRYRGLGHALDSAAVSVRSGSLRRRQVVLERRGVVGWRIRQSVFQRRAGLATLTVATGAGTGGYDIVDLAAPAAVALIAEVSPQHVPAHTPPGEDHRTIG
jgi:putative membrane protein